MIDCKNYVFFLGGKDAEMVRIKEVLQKNKCTFCDKDLSWGAKESDYKDEIQNVLAKGKTPVFIELTSDLSSLDGGISVDHHGERANEPASILQVLDLIGVAPTRFDLLIAANDAGYIPAMQKMGATQQEIDVIRLKDREAQGIMAEQESQAEEAIAKMERMGTMLVVRLPHSKSATVTDRLFGTQTRQNVLVLSGDGEVNYFGAGNICKELTEKFPGGWSGGAGLGDANGIAYFGGYPNQDEILSYLRKKFEIVAGASLAKPRFPL